MTNPRYEPNLLRIKFKDEFQVRIRRGEPIDVKAAGLKNRLAQQLLARVRDCAWIPVHSIPEKRLDQFRKRASTRRKALPDLNNYFILALPAARWDIEDLSSAFRKLKEVEFVTRVLKPVPPPTPPDFSDLSTTDPSQTYLGPSTSGGVDAVFAWAQTGGNGVNVAICDVEYDWNFQHNELRGIGGLRLCGNTPLNPLGESVRDHGTSVVGIYGSSQSDDFGTKGIAFNADKYAASVTPLQPIPWWNVAGAITTAMEAMNPGDIILIEQQMPGPNSIDPVNSQYGFVPVEWDRAIHDAIVTAVANGFIVVEAAGNGGQNLDAALYRSGDHKPFTSENDSGAIMVGAGSSADRSRLFFSNFGSRVDVQGCGVNVVTAASDSSQADLWNADGENLLYKSNFSGTSSASAIVAGCCACLQGIFKARFLRPASPTEMRNLLKQSSSVQGGNTAQHIGPLPNLRDAIAFLDAATPKLPFIEPTEGTYPSPLEVSVNMAYASVRGEDFKTYITLDDSVPLENDGTSQLVNFFGDVVVLDQIGQCIVRAKTYCTDPFSGERIAGPTSRETYNLYRRRTGPRNVKATQGTFVDKVVVTWNALPAAASYDVFTGSVSYALKLNAAPIVGTSFEDRRFPGVGDHREYRVRATLANDRVTQLSDPAEGWTSLEQLTVSASDGIFADHILVSWGYPVWEPFSAHLRFKVYRAAMPDFAQAVEITTITPNSRIVVVGGRPYELPAGIDCEYKDHEVVSGVTYYYWVTAYDSNRDIETPPGYPDGGYII